MLRNLLLAAAGLMIVGGFALLAFRVPAPQPLIFGVLLLVGTLFERVVYKRIATAPPAPNFAPTGERFFDDATGAPVTVWTDPKTGERKYVRD